MYTFVAQKGVMFLATDQTVKYMRPIEAFQRYVVNTSVSVENDKWFYYKHTFLQHPDDVKEGKEAVAYCQIVCKAVLKERTGKTVPASRFLETSEYYRSLAVHMPAEAAAQI
mmetsp:Transcript_13742/g.30793  ORF Transcript_13742/g.30793 Transcript_13742/m.30793 type:complete len:112 (+) Transcript_13742:229-564(+)